jgi:hypothetical protein
MACLDLCTYYVCSDIKHRYVFAYHKVLSSFITNLMLILALDFPCDDGDDLQLYSPGWTLASLTTALHR